MITFESCTRCHTMADNDDVFCAECGHELRVPPHLCRCARCYRQLVAVGEADPLALEAFPLFAPGAP